MTESTKGDEAASEPLQAAKEALTELERRLRGDKL
jgi:hypothetical protein